MSRQSAENAGDFLFTGSMETLDGKVAELIGLETDRQNRKLILIASESLCPAPVRAAMASPFNDIYAEGYPHPRMSRNWDGMLDDFEHQLANQRRYADRRYYKGCEYVNFVEALAQRRLAELFANDDWPADEIYANVQPLSGAAANNAVYNAFLTPGDTVMGLDLTHGGHLTHGSPVNRSGRFFEVVPYHINVRANRLDYDEVDTLARRHRPKMIIAGFSAYPWDIEWKRLRATADEVGAILLADIAHTAGLVAAKVLPSPVGIAHVVSFTTHKTLCGPRGAAILTTDPRLAREVDMGVFPGEQGGPHTHTIAAKAISFRLAATEQFRKLMRQVVVNCKALADGFVEEGLKIVYGGTQTHLCLVDLKSLARGAGGEALSGEIASRILDLAGITCNKNTIPGDESAAHPTGLRFGTTWVTQRGMREPQMREIAKIVASVLRGIKPYHYIESAGVAGRGKIAHDTLESVAAAVRPLAKAAAIEASGEVRVSRPSATPSTATGSNAKKGPGPFSFGYPHEHPSHSDPLASEEIEIAGWRAGYSLQETCTADILALGVGETVVTNVLNADGKPLALARVTRIGNDANARRVYRLRCSMTEVGPLLDWLRHLSDGYVIFDSSDLYAKVQGPLIVRNVEQTTIDPPAGPAMTGLRKPYFIGQRMLDAPPTEPVREFHWKPSESAEDELRKTCLYEEHLKYTTAKRMVPFAGWIMPVFYQGIREEHMAVRQAAGLFDVTHMGVLEFTGEGAERFLDLVTANYVPWLRDGRSHYSFLPGLDGLPLDDIIVYRIRADRFMMVVNAANNEKVLAWLRALLAGDVTIDADRPYVKLDATCTLTDLKAPDAGEHAAVDIALQGPNSLKILAKLADDRHDARVLEYLEMFEFIECSLAGIPLIVSRTGYSGEKIGVELFPHPDNAAKLWNAILDAGEPFGVKPAGLGARDSARIEAGLPLYGHELAGEQEIDPVEAGYGSFVRAHKPWFIGRSAIMERIANRKRSVIRFEISGTRARPVRGGEIVANARGTVIGRVTSCSYAGNRQVGLALVDLRHAQEGAHLQICPADFEKSLKGLKKGIHPGARLPLLTAATILSRFPTEEEMAMYAEDKAR